MSRLKVTLRKSSIGYPQDQRGTLRALGLKKLHQVVEHDDNPSVRGMVQKVNHLVAVEEIK